MATSLATLARSARPQHACNLNRNGASRPWLVLLFCPSSVLLPSSFVVRCSYVKCNFFSSALISFVFGRSSFASTPPSPFLSPLLCASFANLTVVSRIWMSVGQYQLRTPLCSARYPDTFSHFPFSFPFRFPFPFPFIKIGFGCERLIIICHQLAEGVDVRGKPSGRRRLRGAQQQQQHEQQQEQEEHPVVV